ncbi:MAG: efflux RND transporter permease subunit, partial [Desulfobacteraceae bacterium]|nr:efflux RND transporter permease subunit [Desulfobacteraceae bacterium]
MSQSYGPAGKIANYFINSKLTPLIIVASMLLGLAAVVALPREEEPQIIVPMIDIFVQMPGSSAAEVEQRVTRPMEKLLWEIPGVEYIYSTSMPGMAMAIVRFYVGQNEEESIVRLQSKLMANMDRIPCCITPPLIKPRYIDDVPILALTFWSDDVGPYLLRRVAAEVEDQVKREPNASLTTLIGGDSRRVEVQLDPVRMAGYGLDPVAVSQIVFAANQAADAGSYPSPEGQIIVHIGDFLKTPDDVRNVVVAAHQGRPVYLGDVATIADGPPMPDNYVFFGTGPAAGEKGLSTGDGGHTPYPAVTLTLAKRKGTNAINVADKVLARVERLKGTVIPDNVHVTVTRNYGETAKEKSDELLWHMLIAVVSVTILIWFTLGHRESGVVAFAIPVTLALTMAVFYLYGYTLNRITLFALIFSIGILVDDAIVVVENIVRHFRLPQNKDRSRVQVAVEAVDEVGNPTILATLTVIAAILPMAFVGGLMGPYMRPIPVGASAAMVFSLIVAFIVTPWAAYRLLKNNGHAGGHGGSHGSEDWTTRLYRNVMDHLLHNPVWRWSFLIGVAVLLLGACAMVGVGLVKVKMLPFDNKSEFQVILDMPDHATLEDTAAAAFEMGDYLATVNEVVDYQIHVGTSGPFNFNGLVRHYYLRQSPNLADIQVNLAVKGKRREQSHAIAKRVRPPLQAIAQRYHARIQVAEVPPGPPVLSTLVAEVYGPDYARQRELALKIRDIFEQTDGVVDVDWYMEDAQTRYQLTVDQEKAALNGISVAHITQTLQMVLSGSRAGLLHQAQEKEDVPIVLQPPLALRAGLDLLKAVSVSAADGRVVSLSDLVTVEQTEVDRSIYHKNLMPVVYVIADVAG